MMKKHYLFSVTSLGILLVCGFACAQESSKPVDKSKASESKTTSEAPIVPPAVSPAGSSSDQQEISQKDISRISEAFGHFLGRNLKAPGINFDLENMIKGIRDGYAGLPAPMNDKEYEALMTQLQQKAFKTLSAENLKAANEFIAKNQQDPKVKEIDPGKLQYIILEEGTGAVVNENDSPQIKYVGKFLDGTTFSSSEETGGPITIPLKQTIPGFSKGIVGMKEGEKRKLFLHPDVGYGAAGGQVPPNSFLIFEIEVVKANDPKAASSTSDDDLALGDDEDYDEDEEGVDEPSKPNPTIVK